MELGKLSSVILSSNKNIKENDTPEIIFLLPYAGKVNEQLLGHCLKKVKRSANSNVKFRVVYKIKIISFYSNIKSKVTHDQRNHIVYKIKYPGCIGNFPLYTKNWKMVNNQNYRAWHKKKEPMFKHLSECKVFKECSWLCSLLSLFNRNEWTWWYLLDLKNSWNIRWQSQLVPVSIFRSALH